MINHLHIKEASRIFARSLKVRFKGPKKYQGNAEQICKSIVEDCWNGRYFQVSAGHFNEFYIRDFGWCIDSLLKLGYKEEVIKSLEYALKIYAENDRVATTITFQGKVLDVFSYAPDSLAFLIRSLRVSGAKDIVDRYTPFLTKETERCFDICFDKNDGLVREDVNFSSMKDEAKRKSSCYDNVMVAMLSEELDKLKLHNPFKEYDIKKRIKEEFWNGEYFYDDLKKKEMITGDSNVFPFWTGIFQDNNMLKKCVNAIQKDGLDMPFPLKYSRDRSKESKMNAVAFFAGDYEHDCIWMHMGPLYIKSVRKIDAEKAKEYKLKYKEIIEKHRNFLEVFDKDGKPYRNLFYYTDESMLWAANYLTL
ncbi:hypothetical protein GF336_00425 [Candidatus Woesearchaeota archaeon]|nr:hypothetical protein [Candidatus Woesearchaeota archaeon]